MSAEAQWRSVRSSKAAATAGYIYSDKSLHTLESPSKVYLFKRQWARWKDAEALTR